MWLLILLFCCTLFAFGRTHKRYYYMNKVTGDSQWDYPSDDSGADVKEDTSSVEAPVQSSAAAVTTNQSLGVWSYPGKKKNVCPEVAHSSCSQ